MSGARRKRLSVYQRIVRAAKRGHGLRLSYEDAWELALDDAISTAAEVDDADPNYGTVASRAADDG